MPLPFRPNCQPTSLGPLPHNDASAAWDSVLRYTPSLPALPLIAGESDALALLGVEGFATIETQAGETVLDRTAAMQRLDSVYAGYLRGTMPGQSIDLSGLPRLLPAEQSPVRRAQAVLGLVIGPVSLAMTLVDEQAEPIISSGELLDGLSKHLFLRRLWLQKTLERTGRPAVVWVYEPYLSVLTSAFRPAAATELIDAADQTLGTSGTRALWLSDLVTALALPPTMRVDLLALPLPAPEQAPAAAAWIDRRLMEKTAIGWGVVPITAEGLRLTSAGRLAARFERWLQALEAEGVSAQRVLAASLIMPEDTLAFLEPSEAERALALTAELSSLVRQSYGVD